MRQEHSGVSSATTQPHPIRVAHLFEGTQTGGALAILRGLVDHLDRNSFEPVLLAAQSGLSASIMSDAGYEVHILNSKLGPSMNAVLCGGIRSPLPLARLYMSMHSEARSLRNWLVAQNIDILHTHHHHHHLLGSLACGRSIPHLWHLHAIIDRRSNRGIPWRVFNWYATHYARQVIAISRAVRDCMSETVQDRTSIIYNAIDLARFAGQDPSVSKLAMGFRPQDRVVAAVGRFVPLKGFQDFIEMAREVSRRIPDTCFALIGPAETEAQVSYRDDCIRRIENAGLTGRFQITGELQDPPRFMAGIDVLVLPTTTWEGFGLVVLEAHACGRPVVATDSGGPAEIVEEGRTGFIVPRRDIHAMAEKVCLLLNDRNLLERMGAAARERANDGAFELGNAVSRIQEVYRSLVGRVSDASTLPATA